LNFDDEGIRKQLNDLPNKEEKKHCLKITNLQLEEVFEKEELLKLFENLFGKVKECFIKLYNNQNKGKKILK
jgi:hypothetical protein